MAPSAGRPRQSGVLPARCGAGRPCGDPGAPENGQGREAGRGQAVEGHSPHRLARLDQGLGVSRRRPARETVAQRRGATVTTAAVRRRQRLIRPGSLAGVEQDVQLVTLDCGDVQLVHVLDVGPCPGVRAPVGARRGGSTGLGTGLPSTGSTPRAPRSAAGSPGRSRTPCGWRCPTCPRPTAMRWRGAQCGRCRPGAPR